jgi:hypothetical protein
MLGLKPLQMLCSIDLSKHPTAYTQLTSELEQKWVDPILICFEDYLYHTTPDDVEANFWNADDKQYYKRKIRIHFTGHAYKCGLSTERQPFKGAHFRAEIQTDMMISFATRLNIAIGFRHEDVYYILDQSSFMYFEDDCLSFSTFTADLAEMRVSGNGWHQIIGIAMINENNSGWVALPHESVHSRKKHRVE